MKRIFFIFLALYPALIFGSDKFKLEDFSLRMEQITSSPSHVWVSSGYTTVNPRHNTITGVNEFFAPPFVLTNFNLKIAIQADSKIIMDEEFFFHSANTSSYGFLYSGGEWFPHKIVRHGTYHHLIEENLLSLQVTSELIPLFGNAGFMEKVTVKNRASTPVDLKVLPILSPGNPDMVNLSRWEWFPPRSNTREAVQVATDRWENGTVQVGLYRENGTGTLAPGQSIVSTFTVMVKPKGQELPKQVNTAMLENETVNAWQKRVDKYTKNIPSLDSDIEGLAGYYRRSILTGLTCIWEHPSYIVNPVYSTSGIDGGALCTYAWDNAGSVPQMTALMLDTAAIAIAKKMFEIDMEKYFAFTLDGSGVGNKYSYSPWSLTMLVSTIFKFFAPDKNLFDLTKTLVLNEEKRQSPNKLIDYGTNHNLLEMRGSGWEHYVASPNTERSQCLRELAGMGKMTGAGETEINDWKRQSEDIITAVRKELWDDKAQWFASVYPNGFRDYSHSVQVYAAMRAGACTPAMEKSLVSRLNDREFLGSYGVTSVSKSDSVHFEVIDTDWSGSGSYTGTGPTVALTMYERGYPEVGWDVLKRHFWMANHFAYYPQTHFCDRPMSVTKERANIVTGLAGAEAILFGLIGFQPQYNGELYINPQLAVNGTISIKDFVYRQHSFDVSLTSKKMMVVRDGKTVYNGAPKRVKIL